MASEAHINDRNDVGRTPLHLAAAVGDLTKVQSLLSKGADVTLLDAHQKSALALAAEKGHTLVVAHLATVADTNSKDTFGRAPLHWAVKHLDARAVRVLVLDGKASPNISTNGNETPLHWLFADKASNPEAVAEMLETLLDAGADPTLRNKTGDSVVDMAAKHPAFTRVAASLTQAVSAREAKSRQDAEESKVGSVATSAPASTAAPAAAAPAASSGAPKRRVGGMKVKKKKMVVRLKRKKPPT